MWLKVLRMRRAGSNACCWLLVVVGAFFFSNTEHFTAMRGCGSKSTTVHGPMWRWFYYYVPYSDHFKYSTLIGCDDLLCGRRLFVSVWFLLFVVWVSQELQESSSQQVFQRRQDFWPYQAFPTSWHRRPWHYLPLLPILLILKWVGKLAFLP